MAYKLLFSPKAKLDIAFIKKADKQAYEKLEKLLIELQNHPSTGTGKPEQLKHTQGIYWSRRISRKHRLLYSIDEQNITVRIIAAMGHYEDK